jgi:hypothetical protein
MRAEWIPAVTAKVLAAVDRKRLPGTIAMAAAGFAGLVVLSASVFGDPRDGEPVQVMRLEIAAAPPAGLGGPLVAPVPSEAELAKASFEPGLADPALLEKSSVGLLPKIGRDGRKPMQAYGRALGAANDARPKIAIVVGSMGVGKAIRDSVLARLPADVSLAFSPYGPALAEDVAAVRTKGHEVLLEVPLEPEDYPSTDPGVHTLTTAATVDKNDKHLAWLMSRFTGYAGLISTHGSKYLADKRETTYLLKRAANRGLFFVDASANPGSLAREVAASSGAAFARADSIVDRSLLRDAIDKELAALEASAKKRGFAIGVVGALPVTVDRVAVWAETLEARGIALVPVSAVISGGGQAVAVLPPAAEPKPRVQAPKPRLQKKKVTTPVKSTRRVTTRRTGTATTKPAAPAAEPAAEPSSAAPHP